MSIYTLPRQQLFIPAHAYTTELTPGAQSLFEDYVTRRRLGLVYGVAGGSAPLQGYHTEGDIVRTTTDSVDTRVLWAEFQRVLQLYNAQRQPVVDLLTYTVPRDIEWVPQVGNQAAFEKASEYGVPVGIRADVDYFAMGFSFDDWDTGTRFTWRFLRDADAEQVRAVNEAIVEADNRLVFNEVMKTFYRNTNRTAEIRGQNYTVYSFYNGTDGVVPPSYKTNTFLNTHTHYRSSGAATVDQGDLNELLDDLASHGYNRSNGYEIVFMMNKAEVDVVRTFKSVQNGGTARYDFIPALGTPNFLLPDNFRINTDGGGARPAATFRGIAVAGSYGDGLILTDDYFPAGYVSAFATGGPESIANPVGIREHGNTQYRGLRLVKGREPDYPLQEAYYMRSFGTGVRHRGAGIIMKITAGAYTTPTEYT